MAAMENALHFSLRTLQLFTDIGPFAVVGTIGNAVLDICDAAQDLAVAMARIEEQAKHEAKLGKLAKKHERELMELRDRSLAKIEKANSETEYALEAYREDVSKLMRRIKREKRRKR